MNYKSLHDYFKDIVENLSVTCQWVHNQPHVLQLYEKDSPVVVLSLPFTSTGSITPTNLGPINEVYAANFVFYQRDSVDGDIDQNNQDDMQQTLQILSLTNQAVDEFIRLVDYNTITDELEESSDKIRIVSFTKGNAIRDNEVMTGTTLLINITVLDSFDYCCNSNLLESELETLL